jgi:hypothetical protein
MNISAHIPLIARRKHLKKMLKMLDGIMANHPEEHLNTVRMRAKEDLEVQILLLKLEINTLYDTTSLHRPPEETD